MTASREIRHQTRPLKIERTPAPDLRHRVAETPALFPIPASVIGRRFLPAPFAIALGTGLGIVLPVLGVAVIASLIPFYWLSIPGENIRSRRQRGSTSDRGQAQD
jgi:hypothetical protein